MKIFFLAILSYLIGSLPTAYLITKKIKGEDIRKFGSGNIGATNAARVLGIKMGLIVALVDILKGYFAVILIQLILPQQTPLYIIFLLALIVIIGHNFSVFLNFSGGKGVATTIGIVMNIFPMGFLILTVIWFLITIITRYVSLASMMAAVSLVFSSYFLKESSAYFYFMVILAIGVIFTHRENIARLLHGTENRMKWPPNKNRGDLNEK
ncbi:MAG TPA: glycerol-3-phosphate 1-O-acyltransferase PlsY [Halanaerobiales bacterium]|nr:glycerol-3-phosphate 1-O-acyltransferase PlsY [Halanaerobiales bacterium]